MGFLHTFDTTFGTGTRPARPAWGQRRYKRLSTACDVTLTLCFAALALLWADGLADRGGWVVIVVGLLALILGNGASTAARGGEHGRHPMRTGLRRKGDCP